MAKKFIFASGTKSNFKTNNLVPDNQKLKAEELNSFATEYGNKLDSSGFVNNVDFTNQYQSIIDLNFLLNELVIFQFADSTFMGIVKLRPAALTDILTIVGFEVSNNPNMWQESVGYQILKISDSGNGTWQKSVTGTQQLVLDGTTFTKQSEVWDLINIIGNNHLGMSILVKDNAGKIHHTYYLKDGTPKVLYGTNLDSNQSVPYYVNINNTADPIVMTFFATAVTDNNALVPLFQLNTTLHNYVTTATLTQTLQAYVKTADLNTTLHNYVTTAQLNAAVAAAINGLLSETLTFISDDGTTQKFKVGKG